MDINNVAQNTKTATGGGGLAPGDYPAVLELPVQKDWEGKRFWEIPFTLTDGTDRTGNVTIWDFTDQDIREAASDAKAMERIQKAIARHKRLFVDVGVWSQDISDKAAWSAGEPNVIGSLQHLAGKRCHVVVQTRKDDPSKKNTYINEPRKQAGCDAGGPPVVNNAQPPGTNFGAPSSAPGLEDIPF